MRILDRWSSGTASGKVRLRVGTTGVCTLRRCASGSTDV
uniref:Uncharacterized protein n=1 Tax=Arundo donax TaxID=35708 RepID=A0A0A9B260_ARUDO